MKKRNKLVRDKVPQIIEANGETCVTRILDDTEYRFELLEKLDEEVAEFKLDRNVEELADILEVIDALAQSIQSSFDEVIKTKAQKYAKRGGFNERIFLISTKK